MAKQKRTPPIGEILYAEVREGHAYLEPGHWFFDTGRWAVCASVGKGARGWQVTIYFQPDNKPPPKENSFRSLQEAKNLVSAYFEKPVVDCSPDEFPKPEGL